MKIPSVCKTQYRLIKFRTGIVCLLCFLPFLINACKAAAPRLSKMPPAMSANPQNPASVQDEENTQEKDSPVSVTAKTSQLPAVTEDTPPPHEEKSPLPPPPSSPEESSLPQPDTKDSSPAPIEHDSSSPLQQDSLPPPLPERSAKKKLGYHHYSYSSSFGGSGMGGGLFNHPVAIAVDSDDNIYVVDQGNNLVQKFNENGIFIREWGRRGTTAGEFDSPSALAIDKKGFVYVVDTNNNRIQKIDPDKTEKNAFMAFGDGDRTLGSGEGKFQTPTDITVDNEGYIYVVDSGNSRIQKFDSNGKFLKEFGSYGSCRECFLSPSQIAYDPTGFGYLYVLDQDRNGFLLHKIDTSGRFLQTLDVFHQKEYPVSKPAHIYFDEDGFLYVVDQGKGSVYKFNTDGEFIQAIGDSSSREAALNNPRSIVQDSDKRLLIVDSENNRIKIFDQM
ncbi:MAG: NHL repeat-containing protein [bacterium]